MLAAFRCFLNNDGYPPEKILNLQFTYIATYGKF